MTMREGATDVLIYSIHYPYDTYQIFTKYLPNICLLFLGLGDTSCAIALPRTCLSGPAQATLALTALTAELSDNRHQRRPFEAHLQILSHDPASDCQ
jgi:hypothetical protein